MAIDSAAAAPPADPEASRAPAGAAAEALAKAEAAAQADEEAVAKAEEEAEAGGEAGAALGADGDPAGASPFRLADAAEWRVCAPWDAGLMLTRAQLDALLLPAKRKGVYSARDYE